jgi:glycosyltransferase involved in cell wall biosynthesis
VTGRPLRIVHVIARLNVGGAALHVLQLSHEQQRRGHDVSVVTGTLAAGEESMEYVADELDLTVRRVPALQRELSPRADAKAMLAIRRILQEGKLDVLHTHTSKAGATGRIAALLAANSRPRSVVHTYHGHVLSGYFDPRRERVFRIAERLLARSADVLIAVSEQVRDDLVAFGVAPASRFAIVPYGFDLPEWSAADDEARRRVRAELGVGDDTFVVGWAGRLTPIKRPLDLIRTLRALRDRGVDTVLVLLGDGEDRPETEALAHELGVADRARFLGFRQGLRAWYPGLDAFLLTSANEGAPVVAIEALAAERPVVATDVGGTATVVTEGKSGFLVPMGDVDGLAARLVELADDPALRARLGRAGSADVRERFATSRMADEIEALYRSLLSR